jgi:hypothetical protein
MIRFKKLYNEYSLTPNPTMNWDVVSKELDKFMGNAVIVNKNIAFDKGGWDYEEDESGNVSEIYTPVIDFAFDVNINQGVNIDDQIVTVARKFNSFKGMGADVDVRHSEDGGEEWIGVMITIPETTITVGERQKFFDAIIGMAKYLVKYSKQ